MISLASRTKKNSASFWLCKCECGNEKTVTARSLVGGHVQSCGCLAREVLMDRCLAHGHSRRGAHTSTFSSWASMRGRCRNPTDDAWKWYGGRGITICERWDKFENFLADMGEKPKGKTIDRVNNDLGYSKENCEWRTHKEQCNNRRSNVILEFDGRSQNITQWAAELNIGMRTLWARIKNNWSVERALTAPLRERNER